jgi:hypothetical protein
LNYLPDSFWQGAFKDTLFPAYSGSGQILAKSILVKVLLKYYGWKQ